MTLNQKLLEKIRSRQEKKTEFNYGILTADKYVKTLAECVGSDLCYRVAAKSTANGSISFDDILQKSAKTLTYNNQDMVLQEKLGLDYSFPDSDGDEISLPKNTLMAFRHVLTTPRKDRDGDILRTEGAEPDPKMLLLWQHVPTLPIGKMLRVHTHNKEKLIVESVIVDMNQLAHDAAVMIDNDMGRFSHGFAATEWDELKDGTGFEVKSFEIMEESLVSVPSNVDAQVMEVMVDLVESQKLKSPICKEMGRTFRKQMATRVPVNLDISVLVNGKEMGNGEGKNGSCGCKGSKSGTPEETDGAQTKEEGDKGNPAQDEKMHIYPGMIEKSWEWTENHLQKQSKEFLKKGGQITEKYCYPYLLATFSEFAIVSVYQYDKEVEEFYKLDWEMKDGKPTFKGLAKLVDIEFRTEIQEKMKDIMDFKRAWHLEKSGRVLSKQTIKTLTDVKEDIAEVLEKEEDLSRGSKSMLEKDVKTLEELVEKSSDTQDDTSTDKEVDVEKAMSIFLSKSDKKLRSKMTEILAAIDRAEKSSETVRQYRAFIGGRIAS